MQATRPRIVTENGPEALDLSFFAILKISAIFPRNPICPIGDVQNMTSILGLRKKQI
jgi:hypothetical protein